jgi:hypothetical protein
MGLGCYWDHRIGLHHLRRRDLLVTYEYLKSTMLSGIEDPILIQSLSGLIDCYESLNLSVNDAIGRLSEVLTQSK